MGRGLLALQLCYEDDERPDDGGAWTSAGECGGRVLRSGSWYDDPGKRVPRLATRATSPSRRPNPGSNRTSSIGFRVARTLSRSESVTLNH